jgi:hypothetical protein
MKKKWLLVLLMVSLFLVFISPPVQARSIIYDILAKGSQWTLNVDGEVGILELLGVRGRRTSDGGWVMTVEIKWQNNPGTLRAQADGKNWEQHVAIQVQRKNGLKVNCEGYIAMETDRFMAGFTRHAARPKAPHGAWYATLLKEGKKTGDRRSPEKPTSPVTTVKPTAKRVQVAKIASHALAGTCSISGKVYGPGMHAVKLFSVSLYGPNDFKQFKGTKKFDASGGYAFTGLSTGTYRVVVGVKGDIAIGPHPPYRIVECKGGAINNVNFELK